MFSTTHPPTFSQLTESCLAELRAKLEAVAPDPLLSIAAEDLEASSHDETEDLKFLPQIVLDARSKEEVAVAMVWASEHQIPVTPAGARTGLSGGALPIKGGLALNLRRMNAILGIDERNHQVRVQPGVIVQELHDAVREKGLYYAVDPSSWGSCTIGGNLAENAGGPRAVKYGVTKDWVLNLQVVLPSGEVIETGANTLKNSTGYNLTQLMVGSEGTLGVITEATLKLLPFPAHKVLLLAPFDSAESACAAVAEIFKAGVVPSALEFMERAAIELAQAFTGDHSLPLPPEVQAHLLIELDGQRSEDLSPQVEAILPVLEANGAGDAWFAEDTAQIQRLWHLRRRVGEAVKASSIYKEEDTVVPRAELPRLLASVKEIGAKYGFRSVCYGHAGDGNLHVNILRDGMEEAAWQMELPRAIRELFGVVVELGGTLSGEHGIGWVQRPYMDIAFSNVELELMRGIKRTFDPLGIMNPNKILPGGGEGEVDLA